jgi:quercetin dioxygenase-like cupin family protein
MTTDCLIDYLAATRAAFRDHGGRDPAIRPFSEAVATLDASDIERAGRDPDRPTRRDFAANPVLHRALDLLPPESALGAAFVRAAPHFDWSILFHGPQAPELLRETMHVVSLAGKRPADARHGLNTGLFVIHPGVFYPLHSHSAHEVYVCISGEVEIRHGLYGTPFTIRAGQYSITPPDCVHALRTGQEPVILAYVWMGEMGAPNWWWHQDGAGNWMRERWQWDPDHEWRSYGIETVSPEMVAQASL